MQRDRSRGTWRHRRFLVAISCGFFATCSSPGPGAERLCPEPSDAEVDSYAAVVISGEYEPHVRWVGRLIGYCWPQVTPLGDDDA